MDNNEYSEVGLSLAKRLLAQSQDSIMQEKIDNQEVTQDVAFIDLEDLETKSSIYKPSAVQGSDFKLDIPGKDHILFGTDGSIVVIGDGLTYVESSVPEWAQDFCEPVSGEPQRPATLTELFVMYRSISDKIDQVKNEMAPMQLKLTPLTLALQDQQELIDAKLKSQGIEKGKAEGYAYAYTSSTKTVILDETLVPDECMTAKPDAKKIKDFLSKLPKDADQTEYGAQLVKSKSLSIKPLKDDEEDES